MEVVGEVAVGKRGKTMIPIEHPSKLNAVNTFEKSKPTLSPTFILHKTKKSLLYYGNSQDAPLPTNGLKICGT
jgi:hypothetical protein